MSDIEDDSTQPSSLHSDEIYMGTFPSEIVGVRYYTGIVSRDEEVVLTRQPKNPYDRNAIRVDNVHGQQIGHIPRDMAAVLAHLLDDNRIELQAVTTSSKGTYTVKLEMKMWATSLANEAISREEIRSSTWFKSPKKVEKIAAEQQKQGRPVLGVTRPLLPQYTGPSWESLLSTGVAFNARSRDSLMEHLSIDQTKLSEMPLAEQPCGLQTQLLPYQRQGLHWLQNCENPQLPTVEGNEIVQFWRAIKGSGSSSGIVYENLAVMHAQRERPTFTRGGILADDMGLGKTLQIIALIAADYNQPTQQLQQAQEKVKPTLIVCPLSVVRNWQEQLERHVSPGHLTVYVYHGSERCHDVDYLQQFDIVISTYNIIGMEKKTEDARKEGTPVKVGSQCSKRKVTNDSSPLMSIEWRRVVLDEGHLIKSNQTLQSKAVCQLKAERRWIVSGTPIQNKVDDLYGLLKFLQFTPFDSAEWWKRIFRRPLLNGDPIALNKLKMLVQSIALRRAKDMHLNGKNIIELPPITNLVHKIQFKSSEERELYGKIKQESDKVFRQMRDSGKDPSAECYHTILALLTRMRQCCDHVDLVGNFDAELDRLNEAINGLTDEDKAALKILAANNNEDCSICLDLMQHPVINRLCLHFFCKSCSQRWMERNPRCPICRGNMALENMLELPPDFIADEEQPNDEEKTGRSISSKRLRKTTRNPDSSDRSTDKDYCGNDDNSTIAVQPSPRSLRRRRNRGVVGEGSECETEMDILELVKPSSKIDALVEFLLASRQRDPSVKSIVYSQWTSMLDKVQQALRRAGILYQRLDGTMSRRPRDDAIASFQSDERGSPVLLASLRVASLGLNLTRASQVFLLDPWWNPFIEDQATDRVYRLGQTRPVTVIRLVMEGTIEEKVIDIQEKKREFAKTAFGLDQQNQAERIKEARAEDIRQLFGI